MKQVIFPFKALYSNKKADDELCYLYRLTGKGFDTYALVGLLPHALFNNKTVLAHEAVLEGKAIAYSESFLAERQQLNPILIFHKTKQSLTALLKTVEQLETPVFSLEESGVTHLFYAINDQELLHNIQEQLIEFDNFYIGDGHHRVEASLQAAKIDSSLPKFCLSMLVADCFLQVGSINRCIKRKLNGDLESVINAVNERFHLIPQTEKRITSEGYHLFIKDKWYHLQLRSAFLEKTSLLDALPPFVLEEHLLKAVFSINDQRQSEVLDFVPHDNCIEKHLAFSDSDIAICIPALNIEEIYQAAKLGKMMPPHSTYLQPKSLNEIISWKF